MSLKKGSKVEVLIKKKVPHGMWRAAEIVSCDGDEYTVSYECYPGISRKGGLERIKRESVRPSPPVKVVANLAVGDGVEVFDNGFWKVAFIREVMEGDCYFIKLIGSIDEFKVHKSKVRVRQTWRDNNWVITGKDSVICEDLMYKMLARTSMHTGGDCTGVQSGIAVPGSGSYSLSKKRAVPNDFNNFEACDENPHKKRAIDKAGSFYLAASGYLSSFTRKECVWAHVRLATKCLNLMPWIALPLLVF